MIGLFSVEIEKERKTDEHVVSKTLRAGGGFGAALDTVMAIVGKYVTE